MLNCFDRILLKAPPLGQAASYEMSILPRLSTQQQNWLKMPQLGPFTFQPFPYLYLPPSILHVPPPAALFQIRAIRYGGAAMLDPPVDAV